MVNSFVSHELRNPIGAIKSQCAKKKFLLDAVQAHISNEEIDHTTLVHQLKPIIKDI